MARKIIIDCDPGIDDAIALAIALYDPAVEVLAVTSVAGNATAEITAKNLQGIVEMLDPPKLPRIGVGEEPEQAVYATVPPLFGDDGLGGYILPVAPRCNPTPAEKVICDQVRAHPSEVSILTFGPLTNLARAFQRDPELPKLVDCVYIGGGTYESPGNVTPLAEFNIHCDPVAAQFVFRSACIKTLVPLDVTNKVRFFLDSLNSIPGPETRFGSFLHQTLKAAFRVWRQRFGQEQLFLQAPTTYFAMKYPDLFEHKNGAIEIETGGKVTRGMTVFDRRNPPSWRENVEVLHAVDNNAIAQNIIKNLNQTGEILARR